MPDTKITALTAIGANPIIPSTFPIPMVDLTDTSMAASGTTKKVTVNQILGAGGTATLASATITGDLTVDTNVLKVDTTNNRVGIRTASPAEPLTVDNSSGVTTGAIRIYATDQSHSRLSIQNGNGQAYHLVAGNPGASNAGFALYDNTGAATRWYVDNTGVHTWQNVGGVAGTAMTLNSTGLGVGTIPGGSTGSSKIAVVGGATYDGNFDIIANFTNSTASAAKGVLLGYNNSTNNGIISAAYGSGTEGLTFWTHNGSSWGQRMELTATGNVGIGVTPGAWVAGAKALQFGAYGALAQSSSGNIELSFNSYNSGAGAYKYLQNDTASLYRASSIHSWFVAPSGTAGNAITFTQAMTLDASGNLLVGTTVSPSGTKIGSIAKLGKVNVEGTNTVTVSTSVVALARAHDTGGLFFISGYNNVGGSQCWFLVAARGNAVTTIASDNSTGLTVSFTAPGSVLSMNTTSGTLSVSCISMTNQSV